MLLGPALAQWPWTGASRVEELLAGPGPVLESATVGSLGGHPLDAVLSWLTLGLPASAVVGLVFLVPVLLVGLGMTVLLARHGAVASSVGAVLAILNPFVTERLLLEQPQSLLGYAMIPWLVAAVRSPVPLAARCVLVLLAAAPAVLTPAGSISAAVTVAVTALALGPRTATQSSWGQRAADTGLLLLPLGLLCLPWLIPAVVTPIDGAAPQGAETFAVRSDSYLAVAGSVATLGGVWSSEAWPASRGNGFVMVLSLFLVLGAAGAWCVLRGGVRGVGAGHARHGRGARTHPAQRTVQHPDVNRAGQHPEVDRTALDLTASGYALSVLLVLALSGPLLPAWRVLQRVPGLALARDTHLWLGWAALAVAALLALGGAAALRALGSGRLTAVGVAAVTLLVAFLTVPDVPWRLAGDLGQGSPSAQRQASTTEDEVRPVDTAPPVRTDRTTGGAPGVAGLATASGRGQSH